jgi:N-methylhydantoinase A
LDVKAAKISIEKHIADPLNIEVMAAAEAIIRVANAKMAGAIRLVSVERGHDPQKFVAMPFGGGGALHAGALIKDVGLSKALVPRYPGVTSALGCVIADMRFDKVHTINSILEDLNINELVSEIKATANEGQKSLSEADVKFDGVETAIELDMLYLGQTHTVAVKLPIRLETIESSLNLNMIQSAFENTYKQTFGRLLVDIGMRVLNLRVIVVGHRPKFDLSILGPSANDSIEDSKTGSREVWFEGAWWHTDIYDRLSLPEGQCVLGPALLEQPDTTIFLDPDLEGRVDKFGNLIISRKNLL